MHLSTCVIPEIVRLKIGTNSRTNCGFWSSSSNTGAMVESIAVLLVVLSLPELRSMKQRIATPQGAQTEIGAHLTRMSILQVLGHCLRIVHQGGAFSDMKSSVIRL